MNNVILFFNMVLGAMGVADSNFSITQIDVNTPNKAIVQELKDFERSFVYPFSQHEEFVIQHGLNGDYFSFFKSLGKPYYYVVRSKRTKKIAKTVDGKQVIVEQKAGEIAAVVCCILTQCKGRDGKLVNAWYICDLKVSEKYQGDHLPTFIAKSIGLKRFMECPRGFGICMNPSVGDPKAARIFKKHGPFPGLQTRTLNLYSLSAAQVQESYSALEAILKKHQYLKNNQKLDLVSTSSTKDYKIINTQDNTARFWDLHHFKIGSVTGKPTEGATHMFASVEGSGLDRDLKKLLGNPSSTAQVVSYGLESINFNWLTSNQI